jgi:conjugative transfer region protein TrbK
MDPKILVRAAAVILLAGTVLACAVELVQQRDLTSGSSAPAADDKMDALAGELARCRALGAEATHDAACNAAWAQNRARFLAPGAPYQDRSIDLLPATPEARKGIPNIHGNRVPSIPQSDGSAQNRDREGR